MAIEFWPSVSKHGISHERVRFVIENCPCPVYAPDADPRNEDLVFFLGPDNRGVPLEVMAVERANGDVLVIHAMRMREKYAADYAKVMACR
ncbi:MAG: hypothetical protein ABIG85_05655 [Chloroflexota bacterium]